MLCWRVMYAYPYKCLIKAQRSKKETAIRKRVRTELGVLIYAHTTLINDAALPNTIEETLSAHHETQPSSSHHFSSRPGYPPQRRIPHRPQTTSRSSSTPLPLPLPWEGITRITVLTIRKHMDPTTNQERRKSREQHPIGPPSGTYYTVARHTEIITTTELVNPCETQVQHSPKAAKTQTIAEAIVQHDHPDGTDSQGCPRPPTNKPQRVDECAPPNSSRLPRILIRALKGMIEVIL